MNHSWPLVLAAVLAAAAGVPAQTPWQAFEDGRFSWKATGPLIDVGPGKDAADPHVSIKDPTVVFHDGRWHLFATVRMKSGKVDIEYLNFSDWSKAGAAPRQVLAIHDQYYCAPQVFFFTPHQKWYLVYQLAEKTRTPPFGPCFSTTTDLANPASWTRPQPMITNAPAKPKWLDFWVICDRDKAHLFYTSLDGNMWRRETRKSDFPFGWSDQQLALRADLFEASHTYKLKGRSQYLTVIEAQGGGRRYYKAYVADRLKGPWKGLADTLAKPFAAHANVQQDLEWTTSFSHGEILRAGVDELLEVDPADVRFVFQGASDKEYRGTGYGGIPWRLGLLERKR
ncbi:MAG: glycoside hydrolase [Verrucomicrobia bacterium]|nr:glycoside hydrolase [Verrucomicrobiota bacterium]